MSTPTLESFSPTLTTSRTSTATLTLGSYNLSFVGNTPSTVLFFLAMSVGVAIACLFIFFTVRYFVRLRYGLHVYPVLNRGMMFLLSFADSGMLYTPSNREIQAHLNYLRTNHFLRDEFLERRLMANGRRRRRRRRGRYAKMKKLTPAEVESLFPRRLYADWLHLGSDDAFSVHEEAAPPQEYDMIELHPMADADATSLAVLLGGKGELHFDLGTCAICLEIYEDADVVRGLVCGHVFHAECVDPWLTRRRACCPICKRDYYKEEATAGEPAESSSNANPSPAPDAPSNTNIAEAGPSHENNALGTHTNAGSRDDLAADEQTGPDRSPANGPGRSPANGTSSLAANEPEAGGVDPLTGAAVAAEDDDEEINYEFLRNDPNLHALLNELIPLSERVRVILEEHPELDLEAPATEVSAYMYRSVWRVIFWKLMGISKQDLFNWAVIQRYQSHQQEREGASPAPAAPAAPAAAEPGSQTPLGTPPLGTPPLGTPLGTPPPETPATGADLEPLASLVSARSTQTAEVDVSEATRREVAERRV